MLIQHYKNNTLINTCTILTMESLERVCGGGGESPCCSLAAALGSWPPSLRFSLLILLSCAILFFVLVGRGILVVLTTVSCRRSHCQHYPTPLSQHYPTPLSRSLSRMSCFVQLVYAPLPFPFLPLPAILLPYSEL